MGILNPYGDLWTYDTFDHPDEARASLVEFWKGHDINLDGFKCVGVRLTVEAIDLTNLWDSGAEQPPSADPDDASGSATK